MTIDPGAKQDVEAWTTFTASADIPDWISKAYIDSYRGPRDDSSEATKAAEASWLQPPADARHAGRTLSAWPAPRGR